MGLRGWAIHGTIKIDRSREMRSHNSGMNEIYLYNMGSGVINGPALLATVGLIAVALGCAVVLIRQRRAGILKPEIKWALLLSMAFTGGTALIASVASLPDLLRPEVVERGRVLRVYTKLVDPENDVTLTYASLSSGANVVVPEVLGGKLVPGTCVELTHTAATNYVTIARQLAPDLCLGAGSTGTKTPSR